MRTFRCRDLTVIMALTAATAASAQTGAPPPKQSVNSTTNTAGFTQPGSVDAEGPAYVGPVITKWGRGVTAENAWRSYPAPAAPARRG
jgi:hypothetical protein